MNHVTKNWTAKQREASDELVRRGIVFQLMTKPQKEFFKMVEEGTMQEYGLYCSRKQGKSYATLLYCYSFCLRNPGAIVRYAMPQLKQAREVIFPLFNELKEVIPEDIQPELLKSESAIVFKNGAQIRLSGTSSDNIESARGPRAEMLILEEVAAFEIKTFDYALYSILFPQLTVSQGKIIYVATPPRDVNHPFIQTIYPRLIKAKAVKTFTIYDNPLLTPVSIEAIIAQYGSKTNPNFRREHLCELIPDDNLLLVPEFSKDTHLCDEFVGKDHFGNITKYHGYVGVDIGLVDNTAILFAILDHDRGEIVILNEWVGNYKTLKEIADIYSKGVQGYLSPYMNTAPDQELTTVVDVFDIAGHELRNVYKMQFQRPHKQKLEDQLAFLRNCFERGKIKIHKDCDRLIHELATGVWDEDKKSVARNDNQSHADCIMALCYLLKSVKWGNRTSQGLRLGGKDEVKPLGRSKYS